MKVFEAESTFDYSWDEISTAQWRKYGNWNDKSTHVIAVDTLSRSVDPATGVLRTERLITCRAPAPKWMTCLVGAEPTSHVHETSYVNPATKTLTMTSTNLTLTNILSVQESVVYRPLGSSPATRTHFQQDAKIVALCGGWQKVKNKIEDVSLEQFSMNAQKGREGFEHVLEMSRNMFREERLRAEEQNAAAMSA